MAPTVEELLNRFDYHAPSDPGIAQARQDVRAQCYVAARLLCDRVPYGRELSLALTKLEEVMMWANAGIARNQ
jgi:hypothetical protein